MSALWIVWRLQTATHGCDCASAGKTANVRSRFTTYRQSKSRKTIAATAWANLGLQAQSAFKREICAKERARTGWL